MASDVASGDSEVPYVDIAPADGDTSATLTVRRPDGTTATITAVGGNLDPIAGTSPQQYTQRWTADTPVAYDAPGLWVLHWDVTGTGEGSEDLEVYVVRSPVAGGPTWLPGRSRVAAYVPHRTLVRSAGSVIASQDAYLWSWDSTTTPPGVTVDRLIADGAAWVSALVTPLHPNSEQLASLLCALHAAIAIERSWPDDDQSLQRANDMEKQLNTMLAQLKAANTTASDADNGTSDGFDIVYPAWNFPLPDPRYDYPGYF